MVDIAGCKQPIQPWRCELATLAIVASYSAVRGIHQLSVHNAATQSRGAALSCAALLAK